MAALRAIATIASTLKEISDRLAQLKQDSIQKEIASYKKEVRDVLYQIENAKTNEDRKHLSRKLAESLGK
jgi:hypothetical protein